MLAYKLKLALFLIAYGVRFIACDCSNEDNDSDYIGSKSVTVSGIQCQFWSSQSPHQHDYTNNTDFRDGIEDAQNYCRNTRGEEDKAWCYTIDPRVKWEYCDIPKCKGCSPLHGFKYMNLEFINVAKYPDGSYKPGTVVNFSCLDSAIHDVFSGPLNIKCDSDGKWSSYQLPKCLSNCWYYFKDKRRVSTYAYYGLESVSKNGKKCESWKKQSSYFDDSFLNEGILGAVNYCRPIDNSKPWCYTGESDNDWDYCDINQCAGCGYIPYVKYSEFNLSSISLNNAENTIDSGSIIYKCKYGRLIGDNTISCINGEWVPAEPRCDVTYCKNTYPVVNGAFLWSKKPRYASLEDFNKNRYMVDGSKLIYKYSDECVEPKQYGCTNFVVYKCVNGEWLVDN